MTLPTRALQAVRPQASAGVIAGAAVVAVTFAATPFLIPEVSESLSITTGTTGLIATAQVGSFALTTFLAGRLLRPRRRLHYGSLLIVAAASAGSALVTSFTLLIATRVLSGFGLGTLTWIAWADATRFRRGLGDIAAVTPLSAAIASPIMGWLAQTGGYPWVYWALCALAVVATLPRVDFGKLPRIGRRVSDSQSNRFLLAALLLLTLGGSAVFIFTGAMGVALHGLTPVTVAWALSINALTGVAATRLTPRKGTAWIWILSIVLAAFMVGNLMSAGVFFAALALWGFAFWMAVPELLRLLVEKSDHPNERTGDAQAVMAVGRIGGPVIGGAALAVDQYSRLSIVGGSILLVCAVIVAAVETYRASLRRRKLL